MWSSLQRELKPADTEVVWCGFGEPTMRLDVVLHLTKRIKETRLGVGGCVIPGHPLKVRVE